VSHYPTCTCYICVQSLSLHWGWWISPESKDQCQNDHDGPTWQTNKHVFGRNVSSCRWSPCKCDNVLLRRQCNRINGNFHVAGIATQYSPWSPVSNERIVPMCIPKSCSLQDTNTEFHPYGGGGGVRVGIQILIFNQASSSGNGR